MWKGSIYPKSIRLTVTEYCNLGTGTFNLLYCPHSLFVLSAVVCKDLRERFSLQGPTYTRAEANSKLTMKIFSDLYHCSM